MNTVPFIRIYFGLYKFVPKFRNIKLNSRSLLKNTIQSSVFWGPNFLVNPTNDKKGYQIESNLEKVKCSCSRSEKEINKLISNLEDAMVNTCKRYRQCLEKQIVILEEGTDAETVDKYWNNLANLRVEASALKQNFESFRCMLAYVGQLTFNAAFCSATINNLYTKDYVSDEYFKLEQLAKEEIAKNVKLEEVLLKRNMKSILNIRNRPQEGNILKNSTDYLLERLVLMGS